MIDARDGTDLIHQKIAKYYYRKFAILVKNMDLGETSLRRKINHPSTFKVWELKRLALFLHLTDEEVAFIVTEKKHSA